MSPQISPVDAAPTTAFLVRDDTRDLRRVERAPGTRAYRPAWQGRGDDVAPVSVSSGAMLQPSPPRKRRLALARALAADLATGSRQDSGLGVTRPHVQDVLSRVVGEGGVRLAALLTDDGREVESVAHPDARPSELATMVASLRALSDLALDCLHAGATQALSATAETCRLELRVVGERHILVVTVDESVPSDRLQPVLDVAASSLVALLCR